MQSPQTARKCDITICKFMHPCFSSMHPIGIVHFRKTYMSKRYCIHRRDDHTDYFTTRFEHAICHSTHQSCLSAAINQTETSFSQCMTHLTCCHQIVRVNRV